MNIMLAAVLITGFASLAGAQELKTDQQKTLYAVGLQMAEEGKKFSLTAEETLFVVEGLKDGLKGKAKIDIGAHRHKVTLLKKERARAAAAAFLDSAAKEKGATRFPSGLIYKEIKAGSGTHPKATDTVRAHYHGTLPDGTVFDSSVARNRPFTARLNQVIKCWTEGMQLMQPGGKARLVCPSDIAYGDAGRPPVIPPSATLVFDVELLAVNP
jgi:FKBP-type peptidyl-prolyl cis-trans isomerase